ncbi:hypothetical protein KL936_003477 [Ogataea polymorpha]|uniref:RRM domain-containing protein n=1 Tax=Ogataea polymorpha TaxID=460523 RepID=A0A9P8PUY2_9ASCO|nr:hypothetical protein KL936_003477 [Ogataea polymorpha]KAG7915936.1 hypothetical protein KL927_003401 [Ogataea polymorpha]KAH3678060.1 hypothetical protein OGATHE_000715 [Ogataea polymorpha]
MARKAVSTPPSKKAPSRSPILTRTRTKKVSQELIEESKPEKKKEEVKSELENDEIELPSDSDSSDDAEELQGFESADDEENKEQDNVTKTKHTVHTVTKPVETAKKKSSKPSSKSKHGVIYVGRLPHGFEEKELKKYFSQFGEIVRLRLSRNKKTGKSKHYAFIEFEHAEVAKIAAETMNNYLLFEHLLQCAVVPAEKVHENLFQGANSKYKPVPWSKIAQLKNDRPKSKARWEKLQKKYQDQNQKRLQKLKQHNIDYDLSAL